MLTQSLAHLVALLRLTGKPAWATPALITLGLATSLAETLGITLIVAFLYAAMGQTGDAAAVVGGWLGQGLARSREFFGTPTRMALAVLALIAARTALAHLNRMLGARVSEQINEVTRNGIHAQYLDVSYAFMQRQPDVKLIEVLGTDTWLISAAYTSFTRVVIGLCSAAVFTGFLFALSWQITLTALGGGAVLALVLRRFGRPAQVLGEGVKTVHQELGRHMLLTVQGLRTIRAYGLEASHQQRFAAASAEARRLSLAQARLSALLDPITEVGFLAILCLVVAGAWHWGTSLPTLLAATALLYRLQPHAHQVEGNILYLAQIEPRLRSVLDMLRRDDKRYDPPGDRPLQAIQRGITFEDVTFSYEPGAAALDRVSFHIPAARTTALQGPSGAGKTTVINLLLRLYAPQSGTIRIDGVPLGEIRRADWLALLAVAGQDVDLVDGSVRDNILLAHPSASEDEMLAVARAAGVDEFVRSLPAGYDTWIGPQGHRFSGGQRQRLGLARALLRRPQLLILDEATNALDSELEERVRHAIGEHLPDSTVLVISHHAPSVRAADHAVQIASGRVVA